MDFDENIKNFRDTFWIVVIVALFINLAAGLLMKIFDAYLSNSIILIILIFFLVLLTIVIIFSRIDLLKTSIADEGDIIVSLIQNKKNNNFVSFKGYFPANDIRRGLIIMSKNNYSYNSDLMDMKNEFTNEIFQYLVLSLLNRMHTYWDLTSRIYKSKIISDNKNEFKFVNPIEIDIFKSNRFIKSDIWLQGTRVVLFKYAIIESEMRTIFFAYNGINLKMSFKPASTKEFPFETKDIDIRDLNTYFFILSYKFSVSPRAKIFLFLFSTTRESIFYQWSKELIERAKNELDWNIFEEKNIAKGIPICYTF